MTILIITTPNPTDWRIISPQPDANGNDTTVIDGAIEEIAKGKYQRSLQDFLIALNERAKEKMREE